MRIQATALLTMDEKAVLEELAEYHDATLSAVLAAGLRKLSSLKPLEQAVWIASVGKDLE